MKQKDLLPACWILILFVLIIDCTYNLYMFIDYQKRKNAGNDRWRQVEQRIKNLEEQHGRDCKNDC